MKNVIYNTIGKNYNATRQADPYLAERLIELVSGKSGRTYLDIGCGTGNYTNALAEKGLEFYGVDPSEKMLAVARSRNEKIKWINGSAEQLPLEDQCVEGITGTLTLHHWANFGRAFQELFRVLKDGGKMVFFTSTPEQMEGYWLNHYFPAMLRKSIVQMPALEVISRAAEKVGFKLAATEKYFVREDLQDHFLYVGKNKPELYLRESIRNGISSFSALAHQAEVERGLAQLQQDIESGAFENIRSSFENELGDYLFIVFKKEQ